jgi:transcription elongation factor GreA
MIYRTTHKLLTQKLKEIQDAIKQNSQDIKTAADHGDLKENAEYHAAKEEQVRLHERLARYSRFLENEIVDPSNIDGSEVTFGTRVTYSDGERTLSVAVVGSAEYELELYENICTISSPFGQRIMGMKKGDTMELNTPAGDRTLTILDIEALE